MANLTIIRGLPGSGKSTLGKALQAATGQQLLDIDDLLKNDQEVFEFTDVREAFRKLYHDTEDLLTAGTSVIVVASFVRIFELNGYIRMPYKHLQVIDCHSSFGSVHNVPQSKLVLQNSRWESWKSTK